MSWWELTDGSWLGDAPADIVRSALGQAVAERGEGPVTAAQLLASVAAAARPGVPPATGPASSVKPRTAPLVMEFQPADVSSAQAAPVPGLVHGLRSAFAEVTSLYRSQLDRHPTATELAQTVLFVVRPTAGELIQETADLRISQAIVRGQDRE